MHNMQQQRGVALLTVMLVLAVVVVIAAQFSQRLQLDLARTANQQDYAQRQWLTMGAEQFVLKVIRQDLDDDDKVHLGQYWATEGMTFPVEDSIIKGRISDQQSCFNLNALGQTNKKDGQAPRVVDQFIGLLLAVDVDGYLAEQITDSLRDWLDADTVPHPQGAEDATYEALNPPYLPANGPMADVSELRAVNGVSSSIYQRVKPFICVIPEGQLKINVNTVTQPEVLQAIFYPDLDNNGAQQVLQDRPSEGYRSLDEMMTHPALQGTSLSGTGLNKYLVLTSNYFLAQIRIEDQQGQALMQSLIQRSTGSDLKVIRRAFGGVAE